MKGMAGGPGGFSIARGLKAVLVLQCIIAGLMLLTDRDARWRTDPSRDEESPASPVAPGDQVRRYEPSRPLPRFSRPVDVPGIELPLELPSRLNFSIEEHPGFGRILLLNGKIEIGDARRLTAFLDGEKNYPALLAINSPGGIVEEALRIGLLLREREFDTLVPAGMACMSSCPYAFAGGLERRVSLRGALGLHQHYYETPGYMPVFFAVESIQQNQGRTMAHLIEMGVDPGIMRHGLMTPPEDIYVLVEEELIDSRFATEILD